MAEYRQHVSTKIIWHWLYRDFVSAYLQCSLDNNWIDVYRQIYMYPHYRELNALHFMPKGYTTEELACARIEQLGQMYFSDLVDVTQNMEQYEQCIKEMTDNLLVILHPRPSEQEVYVLVGLDCTNIYSLVDQQREVTILCLESVSGKLQDIHLLLAHECHHWARKAFVSDLFSASVGERLITEGLAASFSEQICPDRRIYDYCFVPPGTVEWVLDHWNAIEAELTFNRLRENELLDALFSRRPFTYLLPGMPPRGGYVYGYLKAKKYLQEHRLDAGNSVDIPWEHILR